MRRILITGSEGFVGKNLQVQLRRRGDVEIIPFDKEHSEPYTSHNTERLDKEGMKDLLLKLDYIQEELKLWKAVKQ